MPDLDTKRDVVQNAIDLAHALGIAAPRSRSCRRRRRCDPRIPSTITGGVLDGPLAFDNAISIEAGHAEGHRLAGRGRADILVVPDIEAGNILAKLSYFAGADSADIVMGARCLIALTSRADPVEAAWHRRRCWRWCRRAGT